MWEKGGGGHVAAGQRRVSYAKRQQQGTPEVEGSEHCRREPSEELTSRESSGHHKREPGGVVVAGWYGALDGGKERDRGGQLLPP